MTNFIFFLFLSLLDEYFEGVPVCQVITKSENQDAVEIGFRTLLQEAEEAVQNIKILTSDLSHSFVNGYVAALGKPVISIKCAWHLMRAWRKKLSKSNPELLNKISKLRLLPFEEDFNVLYNKIVEEFKTTEDGKYFEEQYGWNGKTSPPSEWSRAFTRGCVPDNLAIERYELKIVF